MLQESPALATPSTMWTVSCLAALLTAGTVLRGVWAARGSTAFPATLWALSACLWLALDTGLRATGLVSQPASAASLRLVTAALSMCPAMSLLGAKRPQYGVWQLIVASLVLILLLPVLATTLARPGGVPDVHLLGRGFLVILSLVGWMNFVATRRGSAATLVTIGQLSVLRGFLPLVDSEPAFPPTASVSASMAASIDAIGCLAVAAGGLLALLSTRGPKHPPPPDSFAASVAPAFLGFRETLGAAWTLRVIERFDGIAASRNWPCRLRFDGLDPIEAPLDGPWQRDARRALGALLRRFVSPGWLDRHEWRADRGG